jgi:hypothetical protein
VLVPRPRVNLVLYHGVLAPRAAWRAEVVRRQTPVVPADTSATETPVHAPAPSHHGSGSRWADLMRRAFGFDPGVPAARAVRGGVGVSWRARVAVGGCG